MYEINHLYLHNNGSVCKVKRSHLSRLCIRYNFFEHSNNDAVDRMYSTSRVTKNLTLHISLFILSTDSQIGYVLVVRYDQFRDVSTLGRFLSYFTVSLKHGPFDMLTTRA